MSPAANSTTDDYQYQPLDYATQQIRLVTLLDPLENDDAIRFDINVFEISEAPPYTALSYVWGPPPSDQTIYIADGRLQIRENLFKFLTEFRKCRDKTPSDRYMWIDQLCIDQSSIVERNHQVRMMSDIYSKATSVIAWLGDGSEKVEVPPLLLAERESNIFKNTYDAACIWRDAREPAALAYVLNQDYFTRLWIVQEFILASHIKIVVGDVWLVEDTRRQEYRSQAFYDRICTHVSRGTYSMLWGSSLRRTSRFIHVDICAALINYQGKKCTDPRDKVYGLLGLVRVDQRVIVDYDKSVDQLYLDVVLVAFQAECLKKPNDVTHVRVSPLLYSLAQALDTTLSLRRRFIRLLYEIEHNNRLGRFRGHPCPITAMGLVKAAMTGCEEDRFWLDFQGTRHSMYRSNERLRMADETERLFNEDWEKYVPREHGDETS